MTAVLEGVTPLALVRGEATAPLSSLSPEDWARLIDELFLKGAAFGDIGNMLPIRGLLLQNAPSLAHGLNQVVADAEMRKAKTDAPPGACFLDCGKLSEKALPGGRYKSATLLFGPEYKPANAIKRPWRLYSLGAIWAQAERPYPTGIIRARRITLRALSGDETLALFETEQGPRETPAFVARSILHRIYLAFDASARSAEKRAEMLRKRQRHVARMLGRVGYHPFVGDALA